MATFKVRVISLSKCEGQTFGFFLRLEQGEEGHLIRNLETGSPAELSGLKDGDRLLRVNGIFVDTLDHSKVVDLVKNSGMCVTFHVLGEASYKMAKKNNMDLSDPQLGSQPSTTPIQTASQPTMNCVVGSAPKPKLCFLVKDKNGYGFSLKTTRGVEGVYMEDVTPSGVAEKAGIKASDRVLEINGESVGNATHEQIVEKIKASGDSVMFLIVDENADRYYRDRNLTPGVEIATVKYLPHKPRIVAMNKGSDGYGYYLRDELKRKGHFISDIDHGSPAEKAGLKNMDRLVAVNGEEVDCWDHDEVVNKIRQSGTKCSLLVVDVETDKMYKMGGASPFLYWEETRGSLSEPVSVIPDEPTPVLAVATPPTAEKLAGERFKPKLCKLEKTFSGYGFHLNGIQGVPGQYIQEVVKGGAADQAGLEDEDVVVEVNGVNVEDSPHDEVVALIRASCDRLSLLVASRQAFDYFKAEKIAVTVQLLGQAPASEPVTTPTHSTSPQAQEQEEEKEKEEEEKKATTPPSTPPSQLKSRDRTPSSSSSEDERL